MTHPKNRLERKQVEKKKLHKTKRQEDIPLQEWAARVRAREDQRISDAISTALTGDSRKDFNG